MSITAQQKAKEIYDIFWDKVPYMHDFEERQQIVKDCCYSCISLIKESNPIIKIKQEKNGCIFFEEVSSVDFYNQVGQEIMDLL